VYTCYLLCSDSGTGLLIMVIHHLKMRGTQMMKLNGSRMNKGCSLLRRMGHPWLIAMFFVVGCIPFLMILIIQDRPEWVYMISGMALLLCWMFVESYLESGRKD